MHKANRYTKYFLVNQAFCAMVMLVLTVLLGNACSKKASPFVPTDQLGIDNKWVYDSMKLYYYWSSQITGKPDYTLSTDSFFKRLLSASDRFSYISNRSTVGPTKSTAELFGFQYSLINHPFNGAQLAGVVTLVVPDSYAGRVNLKRGMMFTRINDKLITPQNAAVLIKDLQGNSQAMLQLAALNNNGTALEDSTRIAVQSGYVDDKCVYATRQFEQQGIKTGYLAYFLCSETEDELLLAAMQKFKDAGVTELILDLRYNPGGSVASSAKLAAMLVPDLNADKTWVIYKGNAYGGTIKQSFRQSISFSGNNKGKDMAQLAALHPGIKRIVILTSPATISAAELLCNNLPTFMQVIRIGATTYGKDEASFRIEDTRNPRQVQWVLTPIVYKLFNANEAGGYDKGLQPQYEVNDFSSLPLQDFGIPGDPSIDKALQLIYGNNQVNVTPLRKRSFSFPAVKQYNVPGANTARPVELMRR